MRFLHLADLHLGKSIYGRSMVLKGDQPDWVDRFLELTDQTKPQAVLIAGDVYDRSAPSAEAVELFSRMLTGLADRGISVLVTAGNHDSAQRLAFLRDLLEKQDLHFSVPLTAPGKLAKVTLQDACGPVNFWLMPYVFPALVGEALGEELHSYEEAVRQLLAAQELDPTQRNVILAHQNVTVNGQESPRGGSETMVGGVGQVDYTAFDAFDYVALGHIHAGYAVGRPEVRYAGSPLCYHFNETRQPPKGPVLVELGAKGTPVRTEVLQIPPLHPMTALEGAYEDLRDRELARDSSGEYVSVVLTDRRITPEISDFFHSLYESRGSDLMYLDSSYRIAAAEGDELTVSKVREKTLPELFSEFYASQRGGIDLSEEEQALLQEAASLMEGEDLQKEPGEKAIQALLRQALRKEAGK